MAHSFVAYIDESGDEGFSFAKGSSEWFVLSTVIIRAKRDLETVKLVDEICKKHDIRKPIHFTKLSHEKRLPYVSRIAMAPLRTISILAHKLSIADTTLPERDRLYFYSVRYTIERISWLCRDMRIPGDGDGTVKIIFSHRNTPYEKMQEYLRLIKARENTVHWPAIDPNAITSLAHEKSMGLQIADAVANSYYCAVRFKDGFCEDRYVRMLRPVVYTYGGRCLSYGLKFIPRIDKMIEEQERMGWVRVTYQPQIKVAGPGPQDPTVL